MKAKSAQCLLILIIVVLGCSGDRTSEVLAPGFSVETAPPLRGQWHGTISHADPSVPGLHSYDLVVDFNKARFRSAACVNEGAIIATTATTLRVHLPDCGEALLQFELNGPQLSAAGNVTAYSNGRDIPTTIELRRGR